jgi:hypothetical protein
MKRSLSLGRHVVIVKATGAAIGRHHAMKRDGPLEIKAAAGVNLLPQ